MEHMASRNLSLIKWMGAVVCLMLWVSPGFSMGDVYQWKDSSGVLNFSDNLNSVPEAIIDSKQLIVRKGFFVHETLAAPVAQQNFTHETRVDPTVPRSYPVEFNQTIINNPPTTSIIVVNSGISRVRKRPFPGHRRYGRSFKRKFKGLQYIHPEARSGGRIQYIHPEAYRQPRPAHRRGFAGRRHSHRRSITGRRR